MKKIIDGRKSRKLTPKQLRFVYEYCTRTLLGSASASEAARRAGYSETVARKMAYEMQDPNKYPLVAKYLGELREENQKKYSVTFEKHITELAKIREAALHKGAYSAAANAEHMRGKAAGLYIEQKIIRTGKLEDLSLEELETKMKKIYEDNKVLLEGDYQVLDDEKK